jgi:membrane protease subunit (stomatin/prohibitin family)
MFKCFTVVHGDMTRDERLITSVNEEEKKAVRMKAAEKGMTMSEYIRTVLLKDLDREGAAGNPNPLQTTSSDQPPVASSMDKA